MSFSYTMNDDQIAKGLVSIGKRAASLREDVHKISVSILFRWHESRDARAAVERASALLGVVDGSHKQKIINWFSVYAGFSYDTDTNVFTYTNTTISEEQVKAAKAETAYKLTKDADPKPFDLPGKIQNLLKQAKKAQQAGVSGSNIPDDMLDGLAHLIES